MGLAGIPVKILWTEPIFGAFLVMALLVSVVAFRRRRKRRLRNTRSSARYRP